MTFHPPWLNRFASWFFNTSPEWVAPEKRESTLAEQQQSTPGPPTPGDRPTRDVGDPDQEPR